MAVEEIGDDDLDDILESALEEFEEEELAKVSRMAMGHSDGDDDTNHTHTHAHTGGVAEALRAQHKSEVTERLHQMIGDFEDPKNAATLQKTFAHLSGVQSGNETMQEFLHTLSEEERLAAQGHPDAPDKSFTATENGASEVDRSVAQTLQMLSENANQMEGMSSAQIEGAGEDMMNNMIAEMEKLGEKEDFSAVVDGMMRQLLSKELMYEPMKQVCDKYPEWLAIQMDSLSKEDYERYGTQYQYFQRIVAAYETEPDNFPRIMELMQDVQQYGQPPAEIIKELAPGLEFNEDGMPIMPGLGPTTLPSQMPGMPGIPFPENTPDGQPCTVM